MLGILRRYLLRTAAVPALTMGLSACANISHQLVAEDEAPVVIGPAVRDNRTPLDAAYRCYGGELAQRLPAPLSIGVGEVRDYTGKYSDLEGSAVTQGASPMLFSALFKLGGAVRVHERFDTRVGELELNYLDKKRLGSGGPHKVGGQTVPWMPYYGGSILKSRYYIVGGITELNYNIQSAGAEFRVSQTGPKARVYSMSVAADLRLVNTETLVVESAVSVQKQITGYEVGFELFRFFGGGSGTELVDINIGNKSQEPLQLGVRAVLELGALKLLGDVSGVDYTPCLPTDWRIPTDEEMAAASQPKAIQQAALGEEMPPKQPATEPVKERPVPKPAMSTPAAEDGNDSKPVSMEPKGSVSKMTADLGGEAVAIKKISYRPTADYIDITVETDGRPNYTVYAEGNRVVMNVEDGEAAGLTCDSVPANVAINKAWCGQVGGKAVLWWRGDGPLILARKTELSKEEDGVDGLSLMVVPASPAAKGDSHTAAASQASAEQAQTQTSAPVAIPAEVAKADVKTTPSAEQGDLAEAKPTKAAGSDDAEQGEEVHAFVNSAVQPDPLKGAPSLSLVD
jgi:curli biogenesis system outer membrane secretion channel CsgG